MRRFEVPLTDENETDYNWTDDPICPYCDRAYHIDDEYDLYREGAHETQCPSCDKEYDIYTDVTYAFSTSKKDK